MTRESPAFGLHTYPADHGVDLDIHIPETPQNAPASNALLFGLAVLMLNQSGMIDRVMESIISDGVPSQAEVYSQIDLLMQDEANDVRA